MSTNEKYRRAARVSIALLVFVFGVYLAGLAFLRLGTGPFPWVTGRTWKLILGIVCAAGGWIGLQENPRDAAARFRDSLAREPRRFAERVRWLFSPGVPENGHSRSTRLALTVVMLCGIGLVVISFIPPPAGFESGFWRRARELRCSGLVLAILGAKLRASARGVRYEHGWPTLREMLLLGSLAGLVTGADIYCSRQIGMLASPPVYDGVGYMFDAKHALAQLERAEIGPVRMLNVMAGNRYPVWLGLMVLNFRVFGIGEWQAYAVRFWPILVVLTVTFWVVRRRSGPAAGWGAALFAALLPTLSLNVRSAAAGHQLYFGAYLTDLRPDLLFAALVMLAVVVIVEEKNSVDAPMAVVAGTTAALAVLTKATAMAAVFLACGWAGIYVLIANRQAIRRCVQPMLWGALAFSIVLTPWLMAGGWQTTLSYVREVFGEQLPLYSNARPTLRSEFSYYYPLLKDHMGWQTVALALSSPFLLFGSMRTRAFKGQQIGQLVTYCVIAAALYVLVSISLAKNYFLGLPAYLVLWTFCWATASLFLASWPRWRRQIGWSLLFAGVTCIGSTAILAGRGLRSWEGHEFEEGQRDRIAMQQMAVDLREVLSNEDAFLPMPAYGNPATTLFYMPDREGEFPKPLIINGLTSPPVEEFVREELELAKVVLIYGNGYRETSFKGWVPEVNYPYYPAIAAWVQRPGSAYHLRKTYDFYRAPGGDQARIELYVKDDSR